MIGPTVRPASGEADLERIREVARASMTASYNLSPETIDAVVGTEFEGGTVQEKAADGRLFVADVDGGVAGFAETDTDGDDAVLRWLHVDPAHRGEGVGTALFEHAIDSLQALDEGDVRMSVVAAAAEGGEFVEEFGFERTGERERTVGGQRIVEAVYAAEPEGGSVERPDSTDDVVRPDTATTADGESVFLGTEDLSGSSGPFVRTYGDPERTERVGYYCLACGSTGVSMDSMERLECGDCGNERRADEAYDAAYL